MRTPFHYEYWGQFAKPISWNQNFFAVPHNSCGLAPEQDFDYPPVYKTMWRSSVHNKSNGRVRSRHKQRVYRRKLVSDSCEHQQKLLSREIVTNVPKVKWLGLKREFGDADQCIEFSSTLDVNKKRNNKTPKFLVISGQTEVKEERNEKTSFVFVISGPMLTTVEPDNFSVDLMSPGHFEQCRTGRVLSMPKEQCKTDEKTSEFNITFEEESMDESVMNENPNERGRAFVSCKTVDASLESKEARFTKDLVRSRSSSSLTLPDETSISEFMVTSQTASESNYEVTEALDQSLELEHAPTLDLTSKKRVLKLETLITKTAAIEKELLIVSPRRRKQQRALPIKPRNHNLHNVLQLPSQSYTKSPKKCRKWKRKNKKYERRDQNKIQTMVMKHKLKPKDSLKNPGNNLKYRQSICHMLKEYVLGLSKLWIKKSR